MLVQALLAMCALACASADGSTERLHAEMAADSQPQQSAEMAEHEMRARAGLAKEMSDALVDIMAVLLHGSDASKDGAIAKLIDIAIHTGEAGTDQVCYGRPASDPAL